MAELSYEVLLRKGNCVLVENKIAEEYIVGVGYNSEAPVGQQWGQGHYFSYLFSDRGTALMKAVDFLLSRASEYYVSKARLEEISTAALHELREVDNDTFLDFCEEDLDLTEEEREWFGLDKEDEDVEDS